MNEYANIIATSLELNQTKVANTLALLDEGCTIPFISRYRKEKTGGLDEVQIANISQWKDKLTELAKRKETICKTIDELTSQQVLGAAIFSLFHLFTFKRRSHLFTFSLFHL